MSATTFEAVIENGQVWLPPGVVLPECRTVLLVVPDVGQSDAVHPAGARLADPNDAPKFEMKVTWEDGP